LAKQKKCSNMQQILTIACIFVSILTCLYRLQARLLR